MKLNYYVLGKKNNEILLNYLEKYYQKLLLDLKKIVSRGFLETEINSLFNTENRNFILNADISSIINFLIREDFKNIYMESNILKLKTEINIFLKEGIKSENLSMNKGQKLYGTNIKLTNIDNNPYNGREAHPDHKKFGAFSGNWGDKSEKEWLEIYEKTFNLLKNIDEGIYDELNQIITKIIPLGTSIGVHNSSSYKESVGHLYLGYTIDSDKPEINNLEAIIHESSHNKLNLIMQFDPIILNDQTEKYYSAIRPDARHMRGVFIGYHAFAPTMYILMKAYKNGDLGYDDNWLEKIVLYHIKTKFLQKVVKKYAILTELGKEISEEIDYVVTLMDKIIRELKPSSEILKRARERQIQHFNEVNKKYSKLEY